MQIDIDFMVFSEKLKVKKTEDKVFLFDPIRKKYLVKAPEELVRQLVLQYLILEKNYNKNRIRTEKGLKVNDLSKRCDILIYDKKLAPFLLVEVKSPKVKITQQTFEQIARYNLPLRVQYLVVTNGFNTYCCEMDYDKKSFSFLSEIPCGSFP